MFIRQVAIFSIFAFMVSFCSQSTLAQNISSKATLNANFENVQLVKSQILKNTLNKTLNKTLASKTELNLTPRPVPSPIPTVKPPVKLAPKPTVKPKASKPAPIVVLDPGHGGLESGTTFGSVFEKNLNLDISLKLGTLLSKAGVKVVYTRTNDAFVSLKDRATIANNINAALLISIHNNSLPNNSNPQGTETLFAAPPIQNRPNMNSKQLATIVQNELISNLKTVNRGIKYRPNLAVLKRAKMPAIIAEIGFVSNTQDRKLLGQDAFRQKSANALNSAIIKALKNMGSL